MQVNSPEVVVLVNAGGLTACIAPGAVPKLISRTVIVAPNHGSYYAGLVLYYMRLAANVI